MSTLPILEAAANQLFAAVAPCTHRLVRIQVVVRQSAQTACTDGTLTILLPTHFCGVAVTERVDLATGLLVHEVGHFLQPLRGVSQVETGEQLPHWLVNIALDIQAEHLLASLFPSFAHPLQVMRRLIHLAHYSDYTQAVSQGHSFVEVAGNLALMGRFGDPKRPFCQFTPPRGCPEPGTARSFLEHLARFERLETTALPHALSRLIAAFPQLRESPPPPLPPMAESLGQGDGLVDALGLEASGQGGLAGGDPSAQIVPIRYRPTPLGPLEPEAIALSRGLTTRFQQPRGATQILAPGRLLRRSIPREVVPMRMTLPGHERPAPQLLLCLDASGSMGAPGPGSGGQTKWRVAQIAAQALALSLTQGRGHLVSLLFGDKACTSRDPGLAPLTLSRSEAQAVTGSGTDFRFLTEAWRTWPHHLVLVLTDGSGTAPAPVLPRDRSRTLALIIPRGDAHQATPWSHRQVVLKDLRHLAAVMAMLVPATGW